MLSNKEKDAIFDLIKANPFDQQIPYEVINVLEGEVVMKTYLDANKMANSRGVAHGGLLYALSDTYMGMACFTTGKSVVTMGLNISYLKPTPVDSSVFGHAQVMHNGNRTMIAECDFFDESGAKLVHCEGTYYVVGMLSWKDAI